MRDELRVRTRLELLLVFDRALVQEIFPLRFGHARLNFLNVLLHFEQPVAHIYTHEPPQVHQRPHCRQGRGAEHEHLLFEVVKGHFVAMLVEDKVRVLNKRLHVHADIDEDLDGLVILQDAIELSLGHKAIVVRVDGLENSLELLAHDVEVQLLLPLTGHLAYNIAHDPDQEIHDGHRREQQEDRVDNAAIPHVPADLEEELAVVRQHALNEQRVDGQRHAAELLLAPFGGVPELSEYDGKDVRDGQQNCGRDQHGADASKHAGDHCLELGQDAGEPRESGEPEEPQDAQGGENAQSGYTGLVGGQNYESQYPALNDHERHKEGIKEEPLVAEGVLLQLEGRKAHEQLKQKHYNEEVLHDLKQQGGLQQRPAVQVQIHRYPKGVQ
mmetsp:Transcript_51266/g.148859  ORF Transcript_51266/g.148859 Transcript_51266/m.148859 type:complete len:385 (+) Transcript_51266:146-1300(+)